MNQAEQVDTSANAVHHGRFAARAQTRHPAAPGDAAAALRAETPSARKAFKIVVVDDDPALLRLYELEMPGWGLPLQLFKAHNGVDALLQIEAHLPDLLVSDLNMPGMEGVRLISMLRSGPAHHGLPIIVVSGLDKSAILALGIPSDMPVLTKPVQFSILQAAVEAALMR